MCLCGSNCLDSIESKIELLSHEVNYLHTSSLLQGNQKFGKRMYIEKLDNFVRGCVCVWACVCMCPCVCGENREAQVVLTYGLDCV